MPRSAGARTKAGGGAKAKIHNKATAVKKTSATKGGKSKAQVPAKAVAGRQGGGILGAAQKVAADALILLGVRGSSGKGKGGPATAAKKPPPAAAKPVETRNLRQAEKKKQPSGVGAKQEKETAKAKADKAKLDKEKAAAKKRKEQEKADKEKAAAKKKEQEKAAVAAAKKEEQEKAEKAKAAAAAKKKKEQEKAEKEKAAAAAKKKKEQEKAEKEKAAAAAKKKKEQEKAKVDAGKKKEKSAEGKSELEALKLAAAKAQEEANKMAMALKEAEEKAAQDKAAAAAPSGRGGRVKQQALPKDSRHALGGKSAPKRVAEDEPAERGGKRAKVDNGKGKAAAVDNGKGKAAAVDNGKGKAAADQHGKQPARRASEASSSKKAPAPAEASVGRPVAPKVLPKNAEELYNWSTTGSKAKRMNYIQKPTGRRIAWSHDEVVNLKKAYEKWGPRWALILRDPAFKDGFDPSVQLKDKFRNLENFAWQEDNRSHGGRDGRLSLHFREVVKSKKVRWSPEEEMQLRRGVKEFGQNWTEILQRMPLLGDKRTSVDLKDKWRNIVKGEQRMNPQK